MTTNIENKILIKNPPDKHKCLKIKLDKILLDEAKQNLLFDGIERANKITIKGYMLLRLWILEKYHSNNEIPFIDKDTIITSLQSLNSNASKSKKPLFHEFLAFNFEQENGSHLTQMLNMKATTMLTCIENNIKQHFFDYVKRYINSYYLNLHKEAIEKKTMKITALKKELYKVKNDLINQNYPFTSEEKYHDWILDVKNHIFPEFPSSKQDYEKNYYYDVDHNPQSYFKSMIWMSLEIEKYDKKMFQFFPLQTSSVQKHFEIDSNVLLDLLLTPKECIQITGETKTNVMCNMREYHNLIWSIFNLNVIKKVSTKKPSKGRKNKKKIHISKLEIKNYSFDNVIITDGYSASIRFIKNDYIQEKNDISNRKLHCRNLLKNLTVDEREKLKSEKEKIRKEKETEKQNEEIKCCCGSFVKRKSMQAHKKTKVHRLYLEEHDLTDDKYVEFPYIDEIDKQLLENKDTNYVFIDMGKKSLLTMMSKDKKITFQYTNKQRLREIKRPKRQSRTLKYKEDNGIVALETKLSELKSKTCQIELFKEYINGKLQINHLLEESSYSDVFYRKQKYHTILDTRRSESKLLTTIEETFGKNVVLIIGDWSVGKQMRNFISTPNLGLKRKLKTKFQCYSIDEFRTSLLYHKTEEINDNLCVKDWYETKLNSVNKNQERTKKEKEIILKNKNKFRKLHSVLTFKMENGRKGCINRDYNACYNMIKIFEYYILTGDRPERYKRNFKLEEKCSQPPKAISRASNGNLPEVKVNSARKISKTKTL